MPELSGKIRKFGDRYYGIGLVAGKCGAPTTTSREVRRR
jgi:hypothetical protein